MRVKLLKYHKVWDQSPGPRRSKNQSMFEQISPQRSFIPVFPEIVGCPWKGGIPEKSRKCRFYPLSVLKIMNKHEIWRFPISEKPSCMLWLPLCSSTHWPNFARGSSGLPNLPVFPMGQLVPGCCSTGHWNTLELWQMNTKYPLGS